MSWKTYIKVLWRQMKHNFTWGVFVAIVDTLVRLAIIGFVIYFIFFN